MAINSTDPAHLAPPAEAGHFYGLANIGTAGAVAAAGLLGRVVDQGNGVVPRLDYTALFAAADRAPASRAGMLAAGGPTGEVGDVR